MVGSFEHSGALKRELKHQQTQLNYESKEKLKSEVRTRFSYVCNMTESICNNQTALQTMQYNAPAITEFVPSKEQFETLNDLTDLLYPLVYYNSWCSTLSDFELLFAFNTWPIN